MISVDLPVKDLASSKTFFTALGFTFDRYDAGCLVLAGDVRLQLSADSCPAARTVVTALTASSREELIQLVTRAVAAGAELTRPMRRRGDAYGAAFRDVDGNIWELSVSRVPATQGSDPSRNGDERAVTRGSVV